LVSMRYSDTIRWPQVESESRRYKCRGPARIAAG
jgi:hypothetical protein